MRGSSISPCASPHCEEPRRSPIESFVVFREKRDDKNHQIAEPVDRDPGRQDASENDRRQGQSAPGLRAAALLNLAPGKEAADDARDRQQDPEAETQRRRNVEKRQGEAGDISDVRICFILRAAEEFHKDRKKRITDRLMTKRQ